MSKKASSITSRNSDSNALNGLKKRQSHLICNWLPLNSFHHQFLGSSRSAPGIQTPNPNSELTPSIPGTPSDLRACVEKRDISGDDILQLDLLPARSSCPSRSSISSRREYSEKSPKPPHRVIAAPSKTASGSLGNTSL